VKKDGPGVDRELDLTYEDLTRLPSVTAWRLGGIAVASWTGIPLGVVLESCRAPTKRL